MRERERERKNVENNIFFPCECQDGRKKNPDKREKLRAIIHMSTIYIFFSDLPVIDKATIPVNLRCVFVCVLGRRNFSICHAPHRRSHHGTSLFCAYIYIRNLGSFVWYTFGPFHLLFLRITASAHINLHGAEILFRFLI